jgi:DNA-binding response OmpR family regulator
MAKNKSLKKTRILLIERNQAGSSTFQLSLQKKGYKVKTFPTGRAALTSLKGTAPEVVVVNAASMRTSGVRICQSLRDLSDHLPIILIQDTGTTPPKNIAVDVVLVLPFTIRKLENRIKAFLPSKGDETIEVGAIQLDLERLQVRCEKKESRVTPRMADVLQALMDHPGEVIERDQLFRKVWETDFTDDTRTLDVHISWLRKAIEKDPRKPKYLKTIRGIGYRLDA